MGRLAAHADHQGRGIGKLLVGCAVDRCLEARKQVAAYALLADAKDERAKAFYLHYGFVALRDSPMTLFCRSGYSQDASIRATRLSFVAQASAHFSRPMTNRSARLGTRDFAQ